MDKRTVVLDALNHRQPAKVPRDFGGTGVSGLHCSIVAELRDHFGLEKRLVKVPEPSSFLGFVEDDLAAALGADTAMVMPLASSYGADTREWKEWRTPWGQEVLIPARFGFRTDEKGDVYAYPQGDLAVPPSGKMPASSFFIDAIIRQEDFEEEDLDPRDNTEEFKPLTDDQLARLVENGRIARATGRAVLLQLPGTGLGDVARVPGPGLKHPKGIRDIEEWYASLALRPEYVKKVLELQVEIGLENMKRIHKAGGDGLCDVVYVCGTDFGSQSGPLVSCATYEDIFHPLYARLNGWLHANTSWKTFKHCCGAIEPFLDKMIAAGFDAINPVQCSAAGMAPDGLKKKYGDRITFWGGGVDTQRTLPFGTPAQVKAEVLERLRIFMPGGGFVFTPIHNVQARTPLANFLAALDALDEFDRAGA